MKVKSLHRQINGCKKAYSSWIYVITTVTTICHIWIKIIPFISKVFKEGDYKHGNTMRSLY